MKLDTTDSFAASFRAPDADPSRVETTSRLRMWWLTGVMRYQVVLVRRRPEARAFGQMAYTTTWTLQPKRR